MTSVILNDKRSDIVAADDLTPHKIKDLSYRTSVLYTVGTAYDP